MCGFLLEVQKSICTNFMLSSVECLHPMPKNGYSQPPILLSHHTSSFLLNLRCPILYLFGVFATKITKQQIISTKKYKTNVNSYMVPLFASYEGNTIVQVKQRSHMHNLVLQVQTKHTTNLLCACLHINLEGL